MIDVQSAIQTYIAELNEKFFHYSKINAYFDTYLTELKERQLPVLIIEIYQKKRMSTDNYNLAQSLNLLFCINKIRFVFKFEKKKNVYNFSLHSSFEYNFEKDYTVYSRTTLDLRFHGNS